MKACDICGANCGPEDMGEYDEKTGIYACEECVDSELRAKRDEFREPVTGDTP